MGWRDTLTAARRDLESALSDLEEAERSADEGAPLPQIVAALEGAVTFARCALDLAQGAATEAVAEEGS